MPPKKIPLKKIKSITTNYNTSSTDNADVYVINAANNDITINLHNIGNKNGTQLDFTRIDTSHYTVLIKANGVQAIDNYLIVKMASAPSYMSLLSNNNVWSVAN